MTIPAGTPRQTRASQALSRKFSAKHGEQKKCSERSKIGGSRLSRIAAGKLFPHADEGARLVDEGIPIHWWDEPPLPDDQAQPQPTGTES